MRITSFFRPAVQVSRIFLLFSTRSWSAGRARSALSLEREPKSTANIACDINEGEKKEIKRDSVIHERAKEKERELSRKGHAV